MTSRQKIKLGVPFTCNLPNAREKEVEVENLNDAPFDILISKITNTTSYAPPEVYLTDEVNKIVKLVFKDQRMPSNLPLEIIVQGGVQEKIEVVEKKVLLDGKKTKEAVKAAGSTLWSDAKRLLLGFIVLSAIFFFIKGSAFGNFILSIYSKLNAAKIVQMTDELDPRIMTNSHDVYLMSEFMRSQEIYKRNFGYKKDLKTLFRFVGNDFFVTKDLIKDSDGNIILATHGEAQYYCESIMDEARLLENEELQAYLAGQYLTLENFIWPVSLRADIPEWSATKYSAPDNYFVFAKDFNDSSKIQKMQDFKQLKGGFISTDNSEKFAFRCGFDGGYFMPAR